MKRVVVDTNVLVSSILSPENSPAMVMDLVSDRYLALYFCLSILDEYRRVLAYQKLRISLQTQIMIIKTIIELGFIIEPESSSMYFMDESDRIFYDTAKAVGATLISGNTRHFPNDPYIMTPGDFLRSLQRDSNS